MEADVLSAPHAAEDGWEAVRRRLSVAEAALAEASNTDSRQAAYEAWLEAERQCTRSVHRWLAWALQLERVGEPRLVLSLDVDGVLEDACLGFSSTGIVGAAALRLLRLGRVAVILNTARSLRDVCDRVQDLALLGGVGGFGAAVWDGVFQREENLLAEDERAQLTQLRGTLVAERSLVLDPSHLHCVRVSRLAGGELSGIPGQDCRRLLDDLAHPDLTYWVAPHYTDFVTRRVGKAVGLARLQEALGLQATPLAAIGDSACDVPMLRAASFACVPASAICGYSPARRQRFLRSRLSGADALWELACRLVPSTELQRHVLDTAAGIALPAWLPKGLGRPPASRFGLRPRLAAAFAGRRSVLAQPL